LKGNLIWLVKRIPYDKWLRSDRGSNTTGINSSLLHVVFIVLFIGIGGLSFGIGSGAIAMVYFLMWIIIELDD
jgi:hypothetical protein